MARPTPSYLSCGDGVRQVTIGRSDVMSCSLRSTSNVQFMDACFVARETRRSPSDHRQSLPGPPCTSVQPHSFPLWQGVLPISRRSVTHQPKAFCDLSADLAHVCGARAGNRTLNLGIKRLPTDRLGASQGVSVRLSCIRVMTQSSQRVSRCLTQSPGEAVDEAVKSEGPVVPDGHGSTHVIPRSHPAHGVEDPAGH